MVITIGETLVIIQVYRTMVHLEEGEHVLMVGLHKKGISSTPLNEVLSQSKSLDLPLLQLADILSK